MCSPSFNLDDKVGEGDDNDKGIDDKENLSVETR